MRTALGLLALLCAGCGSAPPRAVTPRSSPATLTLRLASEAPTEEGRVAWTWLGEEDFTAFEGGQLSDAQIVDLIVGLRVTDPVTLGSEPAQIGEVDAPGAGGFVAVFQAPGGDFLGALMGRPTGGNLRGVSELVRPASPDPLTVDLTLSAPAARQPPERCQGPRRELVILEMPEVAGEIGNDPARRLCVMLPADYATSAPRRYPVVFLLPGYGGSDTTYGHLAETDPDAILVGVDGRTAFGTTYFHDTEYAGAWEQLVERAVRTVDERFRTVADPSRRGALGHSTGGYNAISLALRRTDLFMAAAASSPDGLDLEAWLFDGDRVRPRWLTWTQLEATLGGPGQLRSYAVQLDDASHPGALVWPFDLETGARDDEVWARWERVTPMGMLEDSAVVSRARSNLADRLFISVGRRDAFGLFEPAEAFHERLVELEIEHAWAPTDGTHFEGSAERREAGLRYLLERL